jgi:hypothetical protein
VEPEDYVVDVLHVMLRVVPAVYKWTVSAIVKKDRLEAVQQWVYKTCRKLIGKNTNVQTATGGTASLSNESWPGDTCMALLDNYEGLLTEAFAKDDPKLQDGLNVWEAIVEWNNEIGAGCDNDDDQLLKAQHADRLSMLGEQFRVKMLEVCPENRFTVYMHSIIVHIPTLANKYGSLVKLSSQGLEALHQWIKFTATSRSNRSAHDLAKTILTANTARNSTVVLGGNGRRGGTKRKRQHSTTKERQAHEDAKQKIKDKRNRELADRTAEVGMFAALASLLPI